MSDDRFSFGSAYNDIDIAFRFHEHATDTLLRSFEAWTAQHHRMVLLAVGVLGFVIPFLASREPVVHPWFLRAAMISFGTAAIIGVVVAFGLRYWMQWMSTLVGNATSRLMELAGTPGDAPNLVEVRQRFEAAEARLSAAHRRSWTLYFPVDFTFYGAFVLGAYFLLRGLVEGPVHPQ